MEEKKKVNRNERETKNIKKDRKKKKRGGGGKRSEKW